MPEPFRLEPMMPAAAYKSYSMRRPLATHFRAATCEEADCPDYLNGWVTIVPEGSDNAALVRSLKGRWHFTEERREGGLAAFTFPPGQQCFKASTHRVPVGRPSIFLVTGGDHRGNPLQTPSRILRVEDWVDDFATHQDRLAREIEKG